MHHDRDPRPPGQPSAIRRCVVRAWRDNGGSTRYVPNRGGAWFPDVGAHSTPEVRLHRRTSQFALNESCASPPTCGANNLRHISVVGKPRHAFSRHFVRRIKLCRKSSTIAVRSAGDATTISTPTSSHYVSGVTVYVGRVRCDDLPQFSAGLIGLRRSSNCVLM